MTQGIRSNSRSGVQQLVSNRILNSLVFTNFDVCVECVRGRHTKTKGLGVIRSMEVLALIHLGICGSFPTASRNGQQYFITFIDKLLKIWLPTSNS